MGEPSQAKKRDQQLNTVVETHRGRLLSMIRSRMDDKTDAEDVLEEVLVEFLEAYDLGQVIENIGAWLFKVAKNKIFDRFRRRKIQRTYHASRLSLVQSENSSYSRPDREWSGAWLRREIAQALELLPKEQRDVFVMHELEGKSFEIIAAETGVSVNTLLSRKRYAVKFLRDHLKEIYDELE